MVFSGIFSKLWKSNGGKSSTVKTDMRSMFTTEMSSYIQACEKYPTLKSFDLSLHQQTNKIISSLATQAKTKPLSIDSLSEAYWLVLEMNQDALKLITESREDVRKNKDLKSLVNLYFTSSATTYEFCKSVKKCVERVEKSQLIIHLAVNHFEKEPSMETGNKKNKYGKTLEELNNFKAMGDPFDGDFLAQYESVYEEQVLLLEELHKQKVKLDKKLKNQKAWMTLTNVVFVTSFISFLILSVVSAAMGAPDLLIALAGALMHPSEYGRNWCSQLWKEYENALESQRGLVFSMAVQTMINKKAIGTIRFQVDTLRSMISSILGLVEMAVEREDDAYATRLVMEKIKEKVGLFDWNIKQANHHIASGRLQVLDHILGSTLPTISDSNEQGNW